MGFDDRDWYRDEFGKRHHDGPAPRSRDPHQGRWAHPLSEPGRSRPSLGPPSERHLLVATWIVVIAGAIAVSLLAHRFDTMRLSQSQSQSQSQQRAGDAARDSAARLAESMARSQSSPSLDAQSPSTRRTENFTSPETRQVTKCVVDGRVSYSAGGDCGGGGGHLASRKTSVPVDPSRSEVEGGFTRYELQLLDSADARSAGVLEQQESSTAGVIRGNMAPLSGTVSPGASGAVCDALALQIRLIDESSRHLLPRDEQDRLRQDRFRATNRQFELHC